ncbi:hypothetical protein F5887DRAFT_1070874 [Amanita rubescens]|nr:hypothetical protein F5887DRAFT_1070874 [Amanita rubescens]
MPTISKESSPTSLTSDSLEFYAVVLEMHLLLVAGYVNGFDDDGIATLLHTFRTSRRLCLSRASMPLERYLETVYKMLPLPPQIKNKVSPVTIRKDRLMFTQSDMDLSNFGVDDQDQTVLLDFGEIGLLPKTLVAHTLYTQDGSLAPIVSSLGLSDKSNASMAKIRGYLGMNEDGHPNNGGSKKLDQGNRDVHSRSPS